MTYATTYPIGKHQNTRRKTTKTIAQTIERVCPLDAKNQGCQRNQKGQKTICTDKPIANGFLNCCFLLKLKENETVQARQKRGKTERDFYTSLSQLAEHYNIQPMPTQSFSYPYNMALSLSDIQEQLKNNIQDWEEIKLIQDSKQTYFTSEERYNTNATLYYIPIVPLYRMMKMRKHTALLLLSVCSYLYHIVDIPYYRQKNSYLYWMYEMVAEWLIDDDENENTPTYVSEIKQAEWIGEWMEKKIYNPDNLSRFKERLNRFKSKDDFDKDCFRLASKAFALYEKHPNETIFRNAKPNSQIEENEQETILPMEKYISFCADDKGLLFQNLFDSVNNELQEYAEIQEPIIIKRFDGSDVSENTLSFEKSLFPLIEELISLLSNF